MWTAGEGSAVSAWRARALSGFWIEDPKTEGLEADQEQIEWIEKEITPPKACWFLHQPVEPLEPHALQPGRCLGQVAGMEVERSTNSDDRNRESFPVLECPDLLSRTPQAHEH
jgi:hypothetical protein